MDSLAGCTFADSIAVSSARRGGEMNPRWILFILAVGCIIMGIVEILKV
jgi:hypothetical protein